jgi:hypothetical protein
MAHDVIVVSEDRSYTSGERLEQYLRTSSTKLKQKLVIMHYGHIIIS